MQSGTEQSNSNKKRGNINLIIDGTRNVLLVLKSPDHDGIEYRQKSRGRSDPWRL